LTNGSDLKGLIKITAALLSNIKALRSF